LQNASVNPGQWSVLEWMREIPNSIGGTTVGHILIGIEPREFVTGEVIEDD